jgi:allantoin racemase
MVGGRFGLLTLGGVETYRELIGRHGLSTRLSGLEGVAATPQDAVRNPMAVEAMVLEAIDRLVAGGADAVVLGGAALAGMAARIGARAPVPLLDGIACAVKQAEALVALALARPQAGSVAPVAKRDSSGLSPALAALLRG